VCFDSLCSAGEQRMPGIAHLCVLQSLRQISQKLIGGGSAAWSSSSSWKRSNECVRFRRGGADDLRDFRVELDDCFCGDEGADAEEEMEDVL